MSIRYYPKRTSILIEMAKKGYNQKTLSIQAGINQATLSGILNGQRNGVVTPNTARKITEALDSEVVELFDFKIDGIKQED